MASMCAMKPLTFLFSSSRETKKNCTRDQVNEAETEVHDNHILKKKNSKLLSGNASMNDLINQT